MRVIVGHERSGVVMAAFMALGHDAYSCDTAPAEAAHPYPARHLQGDILDVLPSARWDLGFFHPDCTYLCSSGLHWVARGRIEADGRPRAAHMGGALQHVRDLDALAAIHCARHGFENPRGCIGTRYMPATQTVQPHQYGHDASKATCLWLRNLPLLQPAHHVAPRAVCPQCKAVGRGDLAALMFSKGCHVCGNEAARIRPRWANQTDSGQNALAPSAGRWMERSRTYTGIAAAMAAQWNY